MSELSISLVPHPAHPSDAVSAVTFAATRAANGICLRYDVRGDIAQVRLPVAPGGARQDELWRTTCFELFLREAGAAAYAEFNFAANGDWAAYAFRDYRDRAADPSVAPPRITSETGPDRLSIAVELSAHLRDIDWAGAELGPAVIIETLEGDRSYWAPHHHSDQPDFHLAQNFQLSLD